MILTARQKLVIRAALSYALSNIDDLNDAFAVEPGVGGSDAIRVGGIDGPPLEESKVQALIDLFEPTTRSAPTGLRAFKGRFVVAIDPSEADEGEQPVTVDDLTTFLKDALVFDVDTEECGNPVGFQSAELLHDTLEELPADEVRRLYRP
jgi:hypothetical protein